MKTELTTELIGPAGRVRVPKVDVDAYRALGYAPAPEAPPGEGATSNVPATPRPLRRPAKE